MQRTQGQRKPEANKQGRSLVVYRLPFFFGATTLKAALLLASSR